MKYDIKAKPTVYKGRLFRSRLEAKWAVFFDLVEWEWEYEPSEINGRNPDFILKCKSKAYPCEHAIVEVKPSIFLTKRYINSAYKTYSSAPAHLVFLNDSPFYIKDSYLVLGVGSQYYGEKDLPRSEILNLDMKYCFDFGSSYMSFDGMMNESVDRKYFTQETDAEVEEIKSMWTKAGNQIMFLKPKHG